jgi:hypothetical protein
MAKKTNAIYAPGELDKVRGKLGVDDDEAKRMAQILGGEVGVERGESSGAGRPKGRVRRETAEPPAGRRPGRRVELAGDDEDILGIKTAGSLSRPHDPADDPSIQLKTSYFERIKMDRYAAQTEFEIKNSTQVLISIFSFFSEPVDLVNPRFVTKRLNEYYRQLELLVTSTRTLFPRNNLKRNEQMKRTSPVVYAILDILRYWNIERITTDMARLQSNPRSVKVSNFAEILRAIYKPLFLLEQLDTEVHIKGAFKLLYKILYLDNPMDAQEKFQELIRSCLASFTYIRRNVHYSLHPLLMKLISDRWLPYERLFVARRRRLMAFLNVTEDDQIKAVDLDPRQMNGDTDALKADAEQEEENSNEKAPADTLTADEEKGQAEDADESGTKERKTLDTAREAERKALDRARTAMEAIFPLAGWDRLEEFYDLYPYFADIYNLRKGYELISPADPLQQIAVLMHILEDLLIALRNVTFGTVTGPDGNPAGVEEYLSDIILNWRRYIDDSFLKEYLPRLSEYCRLLENSSESRSSPYARKIITELHWIKRLYFLPYYKFESFGPPPFQKQDITAIYSEVRTLRRNLTLVAAGIEAATRQGGAAAKVPCEGINNPWAAYNFEVPNPVSKRLDMLLGPAKRNNASIIFFSLSAATILDNLINNDTSWAYTEDRPGLLFRSIGGDGVTPMFGVDNKLDADQIFKDSLKKKGD